MDENNNTRHTPLNNFMVPTLIRFSSRSADPRRTLKTAVSQTYTDL